MATRRRCQNFFASLSAVRGRRNFRSLFVRDAALRQAAQKHKDGGYVVDSLPPSASAAVIRPRRPSSTLGIPPAFERWLFTPPHRGGLHFSHWASEKSGCFSKSAIVAPRRPRSNEIFFSHPSWYFIWRNTAHVQGYGGCKRSPFS